MADVDFLIRRAREKFAKELLHLEAEVADAKIRFAALLQEVDSLSAEARYTEAFLAANQACDLEYDITDDCIATSRLVDALEELARRSEGKNG